MKNRNKTVLTEYNYNLLDRLFETEEDYREIMQALWKTRAGLYKIMEDRPVMEEAIKPQFQAVNKLIGALLSKDLPNPVHSQSSHPVINLNYQLQSDF